MFNPSEIVSRERHAELAARGLPPVAYLRHVLSGAVVSVQRGELGYRAIRTHLTAKQLNDASGVTAAQARAMETGSLYGWDHRNANPAAYWFLDEP